MKGFGKRLKEERERLELSQTKFAEACGVGRTAQFHYEKGDREPSWSYMEAAEKLGVDAPYVFSGTRKGSDWAYSRAYRKMLYTIEMLLGLEEGNWIDEIAELAIKEEERLGAGEGAHYDPYNRAVMGWLKTSSKPERCLDLDLFTSVLARIEAVASKSEAALSAEKKAKATLMLYRSFKASGKVDPKAIEDAIALAV